MERGETPALAVSVRRVGQLVGTSLGPCGANKLLVEDTGDVGTTAVGTEILDRLSVDHPAVDLLETAASDFRARHGDGSTTVVALAAALLSEAGTLAERGVHPTTVERGYRRGLDVAVGALEGARVPLDDVGTAAVARSALTTTRDVLLRDDVSRTVADVTDRFDDDDRTRVGVHARLGGVHAESRAVPGVVLDAGPVAAGMPRRCPDAGVAVLSSSVDVRTIGRPTDRNRSVSVSVDATEFDDRRALRDREQDAFRRTLDAARDAGTDVVVTDRAINDRVKTVLANRGVLAVQRLDDGDIARLVRATGATVVPTLEQVTSDALGRADVRVERTAGRELTFVEAGGDFYTLFCRAPDSRTVRSFERAVEGAVASAVAARESGVVPGGGATELRASRAVRDAALSISERHQLAATAFADALEVVPRTLAASSDRDWQSTLAELGAAHRRGDETVGVDAVDGRFRPMLDEPAIADAAAVKRAAWVAATDLAVRVLRVDDVLPASDLAEEPTGEVEHPE